MFVAEGTGGQEEEQVPGLMTCCLTLWAEIYKTL